jgi:hypothetical protein
LRERQRRFSPRMKKSWNSVSGKADEVCSFYRKSELELDLQLCTHLAINIGNDMCGESLAHMLCLFRLFPH